MDRKINWFIPPLILIIIIIVVNIVYYRKRSHSLKRIVIKQENTGNLPQNSENKAVVSLNKTENALPATKPATKKVTNKKQPAAVTGKRFAIQVASFRKKKRAISFVNSLKKYNYEAYIVAKNLGQKGTWYRVRIGNFSSKNEANSALKEIKAKYLQSFVTSYISPNL